jgi:hypothetical protein
MVGVAIETVMAMVRNANMRGSRSVQEQFKMIGLAGWNVIHCTTPPCCLSHDEFHYGH